MSAIEGKYGIITCEKKEFYPGEPVFILRATDPFAPEAIRKYAKQCYDSGCNEDHVKACLDHAFRIQKWQEENPSLVKKRPD